LLVASEARAADLPLPRDGWASWEVEAVEDAPAPCCWSSWSEGAAKSKLCNLDNDNGYGSRDDRKTDAVRVYAKLVNGKVQKLRTLAAACPVEAKTPIQSLDGVSTDDSARWLLNLKRADRDGDDWLHALAFHRGDLAFTALKDMARSDTSTEVRKQSLFWLAVLRGTAGAEQVSSALFNDKDADIREHATFAITQSKSPRVTQDLIRAGNTDSNAEVRSQAWFWLAQSEVPEAEDAIFKAITQDKHEDVREQAVFALSQLPDERATTALIKVAENQTLSREQRKRALFWLGQSDSSTAQAYLDQVLMGSPAR
jgi:HEAT repeat protein